jgi:hypothetical protein
MRTYFRLAVILIGFAIGHMPAAAKTTILLNFGPFHSVQEAAHSEANVNWNDADLRDDAACTECFAALELQHYLRKATGNEEDFGIQNAETAAEGSLILVGGPSSNPTTKRSLAILGLTDDSLASLGAQEYCLKSVDHQGRRVVLLAGGQRIGTLYAVYDFLHRLGCRWFAPGELNEDIPRVKQIPDLSVSERPAFVSRGFDAWDGRASTDFLLWMARNRLNYWCVEQDNHPLLRKLGIQMGWGGHPSLSTFLGPNLPYPYAHARFPAYKDKPADPYPVSREYQGDANGDGQLTYFEAHPEWYALKQGKRIPGIRGDIGTNYCTSNADATTEFMKNFIQAIVEGPAQDAEIIRFWMLDFGKWCDCSSCKALGSPTDRNLLLVRRLVNEIKKARSNGRIHREVVVRFLAYSDVLKPPSRPLPTDFDYHAATATYYPIHRCYVHNFNDPACSVNAGFFRQLQGWAIEPKRHYQGPICIGEYYNVSRFRNLPICFMHTMANDIPYYYQAGARDFVYMHVTAADWGNKALTNYQMARQLWDVTTDCPALWSDYFQRRYGPAAKTMETFYEHLEQMLCNVNTLRYDFAPRLNRGDKDLFPDPHLRYQREPGTECVGPTLLEMVEHGRQCRQLLETAAKMNLPKPIASRMAEDEGRFTYGQRTLDYYAACVQAWRQAQQNHLEEARRYEREAARLSALLQGDTRSMEHCYKPFPANALEASLAPNAVKQLDRFLGLAGSK